MYKDPTAMILRQGALELRQLSNQYLREQMAYKLMPKAIVAIQDRISNRLNGVVDTILTRFIPNRDEVGNEAPILKQVKPEVKAIYSKGFRDIYLNGEKELLKMPRIDLTESPITTKKLDKIINERTFRASDYTMERLRGEVLPTIREGVERGRPYAKTAEELRNEFRGMTEYQLNRISQTETHSVYNQSKQETLLASNARGKRWLSSGLDNMRPAHEEADGQTVAVEEPFVVMDEDLMYPGDPEGSPENIINCNCTHVPEIRFEQ